MAITDPTPQQQAWLDALGRMERQIAERGRVSSDMFPGDRCLNKDECAHLVAEAGDSCPVPSCGCTRHESRNRPVAGETGDAA